MARKKNTQTFKSQAEDHYREEALEIARKTQVPGQTKEQTKLIARGVAKAIALYKKQEKAKSRDRDRNRRKPQKTGPGNQYPENSQATTDIEQSDTKGLRTGLAISAAIFFIAGLLHLLRLIFATRVLIGSLDVPLMASLPAALILFGISGWQCNLLRRID